MRRKCDLKKVDVVGNKAEERTQNGFSKKTKHAKFSKTSLYESGSKKCSFFGKFGVLCCLKTPVLTFSLLLYFRWYHTFTWVFFPKVNSFFKNLSRTISLDKNFLSEKMSEYLKCYRVECCLSYSDLYFVAFFSKSCDKILISCYI